MKSIITFLAIFMLYSCKDEARKLPYYDSADFTPKWELPKDFHQIRTFHLTDQEGNPFSEKQLDGKISVVDFFFTSCPGICPKMAVSMTMLQDAYAKDEGIQLVSHSVTPDKDSVPVLKDYALQKNVQYSKWKLLTGNVKEIYDLGRRNYFVEEDLGVVNSDTSIFLHTENFVLIDKHRHIRGIYNSLDPTSMEALKNDIGVLKKED